MEARGQIDIIAAQFDPVRIKEQFQGFFVGRSSGIRTNAQKPRDFFSRKKPGSGPFCPEQTNIKLLLGSVSSTAGLVSTAAPLPDPQTRGRRNEKSSGPYYNRPGGLFNSIGIIHEECFSGLFADFFEHL